MRTNQSGQIGVIILLIMVVLLTIGISIASQSSQDLFLAQQQVESTRVFNAAEAGVEQALSGDFDFEGNVLTGTLSDFGFTDVDVAYTVNKVNQLETRLFQMVGVKIDVTGSTPSNTLDIRWSLESDCASNAGQIASLLITAFAQTPEGVRSYHQAYAGCDRGDQFTLASTVNMDGYRRRVIYTIPEDSEFVRVTPLYSDTHILVSGGNWTLPVQGFQIRSEAENNLGDEFRAVEVNRTLDSTPFILDYSLFSGNSLLK
jgi:hypothetical protein